MSQYKSTIKLIVFFLFLAAVSLLTNMYIDWLWFKSVSFQEVFTTILFNKIGLYALIFLFTLGLFYINLLMTRKNISDDEPRTQTGDDPDIIYLDRPEPVWKELLSGKTAKYIFLAISIFAAFLVFGLS